MTGVGRNGTLLQQYIIGTSFEGASGVVELDGNGDRVQGFDIFNIQHQSTPAATSIMTRTRRRRQLMQTTGSEFNRSLLYSDQRVVTSAPPIQLPPNETLVAREVGLRLRLAMTVA